MIFRRTRNIPEQDAFLILFYGDLRCSQPCCRRSQNCRPHPQTVSRCSQTYRWCSQTCHRRSQDYCRCSLVLPGAPNILSGGPRCSQSCHNQSHGTPVPVIIDPSYSEGQPKCPLTVWYSPAIDTSKFTLHILSDTPGGPQRLKYILLMICGHISGGCIGSVTVD